MAGRRGAAQSRGESGPGVPVLPQGQVHQGSRRQAPSEPHIAEAYSRKLLEITRAFIEADPDEGISTDELMATAGLSPEGVRAALYDLERLGIASNDTVLTAFVHAGVQRSSRQRLQRAAALEEALIRLLREEYPDMETGQSSPLHLRLATQKLKDDGHAYALPELLRRIVRSIAADGRGEGGSGGSLGVRGRDRETLQLTLQRDWKGLERTAEVRRGAASRLLDHLLDCLPSGMRGTDLLAETTLGKLLNTIKSDMGLTSEVRDPSKLMDRALLWLHEQEVIRLNRGLTVFRPAMTIRLKSERRGFAEADFAPLNLHYDEQTLQIHVMAEYVQQGLGAMSDALRLAMGLLQLAPRGLSSSLAAGPRGADLTPDHAGIMAEHCRESEQSHTTKNRGGRPGTDERAGARRPWIRQDQGTGTPHRLSGSSEAGEPPRHPGTRLQPTRRSRNPPSPG